MSLNRTEVAKTRQELEANLALSELSASAIRADLSWSDIRLRSALSLEGDPVDVWLLRDYLEQAVIDRGIVPVPFTVLTEQSRTSALQWFALQEAPRHRFATDGAQGS